MGLFDWFKGKKKQDGALGVERDSKGRWIEVSQDKCGCGGKCGCKSEPSVIPAEKVIRITKATTDAKPTTIPKATVIGRNVKADMDKIEANVEKRLAAEKSAPKKPISKSQERRLAIENDVAETPVPKKVVKKSVAPKSVTKPAPKVTGEAKKAAPKKKK